MLTQLQLVHDACSAPQQDPAVATSRASFGLMLADTG